MALKRKDGKKFRWNIYSKQDDWDKVVKIQEHLRLRSRQDVFDIAIDKLYNEIFKNEIRTKEN